MIDLHHLETFRVLAMTNSFTRTATELGYCQSTVTTHIKSLENELGAPLFVRSRFSKTVALTAEGSRALKFAEQLLTLADQAKNAVQRQSDPAT